MFIKERTIQTDKLNGSKLIYPVFHLNDFGHFYF